MATEGDRRGNGSVGKMQCLTIARSGDSSIVRFGAVSPEDVSQLSRSKSARVESTSEPAKPTRGRGRAHVSSCTCLDCRKLRFRKEKSMERSPTRQAFRMHKSGIKLIRATFLKHVFRESVKGSWNVMWTSAHLKASEFKGLHRCQRVNQFPRSMEITRKDALCRNISRMQVLHGYSNFGFIPRSFILPAEHSQLQAAAEENPALLWIVKPASSAQGKGIFVTRDVDAVVVDTREDNAMVTEYVPNPLLVDGLKFDLRIYVAVTSFNPLRAYVYDQGLARFATTQYSTDDAALRNRFMHLTNYSVNKNSNAFDNADADGSGSKWTLTALWARLRETGIDVDLLQTHIDDIIVKTLISIEAQVNAATDMFVPHHANCFELFGFDVLVDADLRPWLLEVNFAPSLNVDASLDHRVKAPLVADLFTLCGIPHYDARRINAKGLNARGPAGPGLLRSASSMTGPGLGSSKDKAASERVRHERRTAGLGNVEEMSPRDRREVVRAVEERARAPRFRPIFPTSNAHLYSKFFERELPFNTLLANYFFRQAAAPSPERRFKTGAGSVSYKQAGRRDARQRPDVRKPGGQPGLRSPPTSPLRARPVAAGAGASAARRLGAERDTRGKPLPGPAKTGEQLLVLQRRLARTASQQLPTFV